MSVWRVVFEDNTELTVRADKLIVHEGGAIIFVEGGETRKAYRNWDRVEKEEEKRNGREGRAT